MVGLLFAVLIPMLQTNGVEVNWKWSVVVYSTVLVGFAWTFLTHAAPHRGTVFRMIGSAVVFVAIGLLGAWGTRTEYKREHNPPPVLMDTNSTAALAEFKSLKSALVTNQSSDLREADLSLLKHDQPILSNEVSNLYKMHELIRPDDMSLNSLRQERDLELTLKEKRQEQADNQQKIEVIENQKNDEKAKIEREQAEKEATSELAEKQKQLTEESLAVFDYVIRQLDEMLGRLSKETGEKLYSDFLPGDEPNAYKSKFVKNGKISFGNNVISLGTNDNWSFRIRGTMANQNGNFSKVPQPISFANLRIWCKTTNGMASLTVAACVPQYRIYESENPKIDGVSITLQLPNGLGFRTNCPISNYTKSIDASLRHLLEAQDQRCPLPLK